MKILKITYILIIEHKTIIKLQKMEEIPQTYYQTIPLKDQYDLVLLSLIVIEL